MMNALPLVIAAAAGLFLFSRGRAKAEPDSDVLPLKTSKRARIKRDSHQRHVRREVKRIVRESREIIDGKRDSYSNGEKADATKAAKVAKRLHERHPHEAKRAEREIAEENATRVKVRKLPKPPVPTPAPAPKPVPKPVPTPAPAPKPVATLPPGADLEKARQTAPKVAKHLSDKGRELYSRPVLRAWQTAAGIAADGIYGRGSYAAMKALGVERPPRPFYQQGTEFYPWSAPEITVHRN